VKHLTTTLITLTLAILLLGACVPVPAAPPASVASTVAVPAATIRPDRPLYEALHQMVELKREELLIIDGEGGQRVADILTSVDVNAVLEQVSRAHDGAGAPLGRSVFGAWVRGLHGPSKGGHD